MYKCTECGVICKSVYDLLVAERNCPLEAAACPTAEMIEGTLTPLLRNPPLKNSALRALAEKGMVQT